MKNFDMIKFKMTDSRPLFTFTWPIFDKPNVTFQERMHLENFRLNHIQNGRRSAIIHFRMAVTRWLDHY